MSMKFDWHKWLPLMILLGLSAIFALQNPTFLDPRNLTNLARQVSVNAILASGMTLVILLGAIDLSIGSVLALSAVTGALIQQAFFQSPWAFPLSTIAVFGSSMAITSFTGYFVPRFRIPPFVVTLGFLVSARGLALAISGGSRIGPLTDSYRWMGTAFVPPFYSLVLILLAAAIGIAAVTMKKEAWPLKSIKIVSIVLVGLVSSFVFYSYQGIPVPVLAMAVVIAAVWFLLDKTVLGRWIYAVGGNPEAARLCGLPVRRVYFWVYLILGALVGLAALIDSGRIDAGDPNGGNLYELDAIAAVVIGGTSLQGGVGRITGTFLGAMLIGVLNNALSLMNVESNRQMIMKGVIIIFAVWIDVVARNKRT